MFLDCMLLVLSPCSANYICWVVELHNCLIAVKPMSAQAIRNMPVLQVIAAGRRKFFYVYDLGGAKVERVSKIQGFDKEKSWETFAASPSQDNPTVAFLANGAPEPVTASWPLPARLWMIHTVSCSALVLTSVWYDVKCLSTT